MKKALSIILAVVMLATFVACSGGGDQTAADGSWAPSKNISFAVASSAGGGSDLFTRKIAELLDTQEIVDKTIIVSNETDGGGEVIRNKVANTTNDDHLILAFMSGAISGMVSNTDLRMENFTPLAILASDKHLLFKGEHSVYPDIESFIEAAQAGEKIVIGGSKNDDITLKNMFLAEIGVPEDANVEYIIYDSTADALVALLGGHIELCISKPSASMEYVKAGRIEPVLACADERFGEPFDQAPLLSEVGDYEDIQIPLWRGIVGPGDMDPAVRDYYVNAFAQVAQTEEWKAYCEENLLIPMDLTGDAAAEYMMNSQQTVIDNLSEE